jgi:hypothetical protein
MQSYDAPAVRPNLNASCSGDQPADSGVISLVGYGTSTPFSAKSPSYQRICFIFCADSGCILETIDTSSKNENSG